MFEKENYFSILLKYCEMVDKFNGPAYKTRMLIMARKLKTSIDHIMVLGKYYNIDELCASEKEVKQICQFLGLSVNSKVLKR